MSIRKLLVSLCVITALALCFSGCGASGKENPEIVSSGVSVTQDADILIETTDDTEASEITPDTGLLTGTIYTEKVSLLHLTTPEQFAAGYKGGEGWQMVLCMDISISNPQNLIFGVDTSGIWKSEDGGKTWKLSSNGFDAICAVAVAFDPDNSDIIYALGGSASSPDPYIYPAGDGLYLSENGGASWRRIYDTMVNRRFCSRLIGFGIDDLGNKTVFVGMQEDGVLISRDGVNFSPIDSLTDTGSIYDIDVSGGRVLVATEKKGIMMSTDSGRTWSARNGGIVTSGDIKARSLTVDPLDPLHWFCIAQDDIYQTEDGGGRWSKLETSDKLRLGLERITHQKLLFSSIPDDGSSPRLYLYMNATSYPLRVSTDYGETWNNPEFDKTLAYNSINTGYYSEGFTADKTNPDNIWLSWGGEIYGSHDGGMTFTPSSSGYSGANVTKILFDGNDDKNIYITAIDYGISRSLPAAGTTDERRGEYPSFRYLTGVNGLSHGGRSSHGITRDPNDPLHVFTSVGGWYESCLMESFDGGESWDTAGGGEIINMVSQRMLLAYHKDDPSFIYAGNHFSEDNGKTWEKYDGNRTVYAAHPGDNDIVYSVLGQKEIYFSTDRGANWRKLSAGNIKVNSTFFSAIRRITPDARDPGTIWMTRGGQPPVRMRFDLSSGEMLDYKVYGERDGFVANSSGLVSIWTIAQNPRDPMHLIAGGADYVHMLPGSGFFESTDGGDTWAMVEGMDGPRDVRVIEFHPSLPQVWMGTSAGIWIYDYSGHNITG